MFFFVSVLWYTVTSVLTMNIYNKTSACEASETDFENNFVNLTNYCTDKPCLTKCCGDNEVLLVTRSNQTKICVQVNELGLKNMTLHYSDLKIYKSDIQSDPILTNKSIADFNLVQSKMFLDDNCAQEWPKILKGYVLENGKFAGDMKHIKPERWFVKEAQGFCVEVMVTRSKNDSGYLSRYSFFLVKPHIETTDQTTQLKFTGTGMLISSFFFLLVLVVYCALPQLQNLSGMLLMAYVATMFLSFLLKGFVIFNPQIHFKTCKIISPLMYFLFISSFLWLNTMSFDIWWTFRGIRLKLPTERYEDVVKFLYSVLYTWGVAGTMTTIAIFLDNAELSNWPNIIRPAFSTCFHEVPANTRYIYVPIGIITIINILFFLTTVYNVWRSKKSLDDFDSDSSSNKKNQNWFRLYIKMSLLMGVSWALEVAQAFNNDVPTWLYILINIYNTFLGVIIFFLFIFNKTIFVMLCKR